LHDALPIYTSQVVATGFAFSDAAGKIATVVKLTRNALMGAVIVALGLIYGRKRDDSRARGGIRARLRQSIPAFVIGFLAMAVLNTLGLFAWLSQQTGGDVGGLLQSGARWLILFALAGVGL